MHKLVTILLGSTTLLAGCADNVDQTKDWRLDGGCEKYFTVTTREYADCMAFVKSQENKNKPKTADAKGSVSLDPQGAYFKEDQDEKINRDTDHTLTE